MIKNMETIYIAEDDESIRTLLEMSLANFNYKTESFENGLSAYERLKSHKPDLLILDIMLPGMDGYTLLKEIRTKASLQDLPVLILSAKDSEIDKIKGLDLGADDYLTKPFSVLELAARIRSLLRRSKKSPAKLSSRGMNVNLEARTVTIDDKPVTLTYKEFELLKYFMENENRALSRDELLSHIWGYDYVGETRTLDVHVNSLRKKIGKPYSNSIQSVRQVGYKYVSEN